MKKCQSLQTVDFDASAYTVLIMSSNTDLKNSTKKSLEYFNVIDVDNFKEALEVLKNQTIDFAVVDDTFANALMRLKACEDLIQYHQNLKVVLITQELEKDEKIALLACNVIDFIDKDELLLYNLSTLFQTFQAYIKNRFSPIVVYTQNQQAIDTIETFLHPFCYTLFTVFDYKQLQEVLHDNSTALLLFDLSTQTQQNFEFLLQLQNSKQTQFDIACLGFATKCSSSLMSHALKAGFLDVLNYPFNPEEFLYKIQNILAQQNKKNELLYSTQLLEQYKQTVDRSSIVSKTDPKGNITYVNEAFCKISGYTQEELLGKPHNIVRHPDMDSAIFSYIWHTIKELKKPWIGQVKNRKKNGSEYWVQTVINPILDAKGEVIEYIGIRTDITDIENTKKYLREQFSITEDKFIEVMNLSKLYESAIDNTNIIIRSNLNREITYANDLFYKISGYSAEELIGQPYSYIRRHPDTKDEEIAQMWKTIEQGEIWKGKIKNISKNGEPYYSMATVVPIKNSKDEILEYMSIRQDITELVLLHEEIEATQREIVYKMGEIGETRSKETGNHVKRVATYSKLLAQLYGLSNEEADILFTASPMHDIGKVGIPDAVLNKPARLNEDEWKIMKTHAIIGYNILKSSKRKVLKAAAIVARDHHEKWDGSGYPKKRKAEEIHIFGRITAVADVFDALGSDRCYKKAWDDEKIIQLFKEERGKHFEPKLVDLFLENIDSFYAIRKKYQD
jgi:PAS domain S-box-containing protein